jgi:hypothetical protein
VTHARTLTFATLLFAAPVAALAQANPVFPGQPITTHAFTECLGTTQYGDAFSTCADSQVVENPLTLGHVAGTGTATADLHSGQLKAVATSQALSGSDAVRAGGLAVSELYDTLTIHGPLTGAVPITMHMSLDGSFFTTDATNPNTQSTDVRASLVNVAIVGSGSGVDITQDNAGDVYLADQLGSFTSNLNPVTGRFDPKNTRVDLSATFFVSPSSPSFTFLARLFVTSALGFTDPPGTVKQARVDFGDTAHLSIDLPDGYSFTSSSGVFLTDVAAPVPEPGTEWLLLAGLLPLMAHSFARKRARRPGGRAD